MASDWQPSKLGDVIAVNPSRPLVKGSHSVYISMQQVETANRSVNEIDHRTFKGSGARFQNGDTLLARITPCLENGKTAYVDFLDDEEVGHGSTEFIVLSGIEGVSDDLFVYYLARFPEFRNFAIVRMEGSSGRQRVPAPTLKKYVFACPSYDEQRAIAHILGSLDDKIELNRRMNQTLEATARAIFKSWFVDFDPVRAKAEGRPTGLPDDIAALFPDSFEDSELGEIPRGWKVNTVEESAEKVACGPFGSSIKVSTFVPKGVPIISGQHLNGIRLLDQANSFITTEHAEKLKNANVYRGDVIFTHAGNIGQVAFIPETSKYDRYVLSQRQFYLRCNREIVSPFYMAHYFKSPDGQHKLLANTSSTGVPSISRPVSYLKSIKFVLPPKDLIDAFDEYVRPTHLLAAKNDDESNTLASLRDTLLPKLISGELRVPDAEKFVEEAGL